MEHFGNTKIHAAATVYSLKQLGANVVENVVAALKRSTLRLNASAATTEVGYPNPTSSQEKASRIKRPLTC